MIVAIDGPAGAGKSTISRLLADRYGWTYLDTGAMYRVVTLLALERGIDTDDGDKLGELADGLEIDFRPGPGGAPRVFVGEREVTEAIRSREVTAQVSPVSAHTQVREALLGRQRQRIARGEVVVDGRDIGTVVCPDADVKIFLTASVSERARRRRRELADKGIEVAPEQMELEIAARDEYDSSREVAPLKQAEDAVEVDSTRLGIDAVVDAIAAIVEAAGSALGTLDLG